MNLRLAFRVEGHMWNAYAAKTDTMVGAIWLGSIAMRFVEGKRKNKATFMKLMKDAFAEVLKDISGGKVEYWIEQAAPEHERSKS